MNVESYTQKQIEKYESGEAEDELLKNNHSNYSCFPIFFLIYMYPLMIKMTKRKPETTLFSQVSSSSKIKIPD